MFRNLERIQNKPSIKKRLAKITTRVMMITRKIRNLKLLITKKTKVKMNLIKNILSLNQIIIKKLIISLKIRNNYQLL